MAAKVVPIIRHRGKSVYERLAVVAMRRAAIPVYALDRPNRCPDCHGEAFFVGRVTAECGGCGLPLPIVSFRRVS